MPIIEQVNIVGIASCVPSQELDNYTLQNFSSSDVAKIIDNTGVKKRRITQKICSSDLCYRAAMNLFSSLDCDPDSIDIVIFVSQTPDYVLPATACTLQHRLGLSKNVMAFDINLGCSGYVYGLIVAAQMLSTGAFKRVLLLTGDTISKLASEQDKTVAFLFGDAGAATLLEHDSSAAPMIFDYGTDGADFDKLIVEAGGCRSRSDSSVSQRACDDVGNYRAKSELFMSGTDVFSFTIKEVPKTILKTLSEAKWSDNDVTAYFFHQANAFMLKHLVKKLGLNPEKAPIEVEEFGNTSVASIPLTICLTAEKILTNSYPAKLILAGFGVGFSWATMACQLTNTKILTLEYYGDESSL